MNSKTWIRGAAAGTILLACAQESFAQKRPMNVEDVLALASVGDPQISPDGRWVAYVVTTPDFEENLNDSEIWVVAADDGEPLQLTSHKGSDDSPQWAADSSWLGFLSDRSEEQQVYGIRPDGGEAWKVTDWTRGIGSFRLSPEGKRIAFVAKPEKTEEQETVEKERGRPRVRGEAYADDWALLWVASLENGRAQEATRNSPDGRIDRGPSPESIHRRR